MNVSAKKLECSTYNTVPVYYLNSVTACNEMYTVLTRDDPTPTNISTKSDPETLKNGTAASPATALASRVLPVPGGPVKMAPYREKRKEKHKQVVLGIPFKTHKS